jgi:hypothetical protein
VQWR